MRALFLGVTLAFAMASAANASVIFELGNNPQPNEQNILFTDPESGLSVIGEVDHTGIGVDFNTLTGQTLLQNAQGQADILNAATSHNKNLPLTSMEVSIPGFGFGDFILNLVNGSGTAHVVATAGVSGTFEYDLGPGQNYLTILASLGDFLTDIKITGTDTTFGFDQFKQPRVSEVCELNGQTCTIVPVPEPGTLAILGASLLGLALVLRRRNRTPGGMMAAA